MLSAICSPLEIGGALRAARFAEVLVAGDVFERQSSQVYRQEECA